MMDGGPALARMTSPAGENPRGLARELLEASKPGERAFVMLGSHLSEALDIVQTLTDGLGGLSDLIGGASGSATVDGLDRAAKQVASLTTNLKRQGDCLARLTDVVQTGASDIRRLLQTVNEVGVLGTNAKIQLAHISGGNDDLAQFTSEILRLATMAKDGLNHLEHVHSGIRALIGQARASLTTFTLDHEQAVTEVGQRLHTSLELLDAQNRHNRDAVEKTFQHSKNIAEMTGRAVIALQINDSTRQRIEHVAQALEQTADILSDPPREISMDDIPARIATMIYRLQSAQLGHTEEQFSAEFGQLTVSLDALARDSEKMVEEHMALDKSDGADGSIFDQLETQLNEAAALYAKVNDARNGTHALIDAISDGVAQMTSSITAVHEIEADIRIMGLNATLRCSRLGKNGAALTIIAQALRQCANRTQEQAQSIGVNLQSLVREAELLASSVDGHTEAHEAGDTIEAMTSALGALLDSRRSFETRRKELLASAENVRETLAGAVSASDIKHELCRAIMGIKTRLDDLARTVTIPDGDERPLAAQALGLLNVPYTMAVEREIHERFLHGADVVPAPGMPVGQDDDGLDDFLF